jgi:hypothetical protein
MKATLIIISALACLALSYEFGYHRGREYQLEINREEIKTIASDYHKCLQREEVRKEHFRDCAWISHNQIDEVSGDGGHWIQLKLDRSGYGWR